MLREFLMRNRHMGLIRFTERRMMCEHLLRCVLLLIAMLAGAVLCWLLGWSNDQRWLIVATVVAVSDVYDVLLRVISSCYGYWRWGITDMLVVLAHVVIIAGAVLSWMAVELLGNFPDVAGLTLLVIFCVLQALMAILTIRKFSGDWRHWREGIFGQKSGRSFPEYVKKMSNWSAA